MTGIQLEGIAEARPTNAVLAAIADAELIVIGMRHRTAVGKFLMGSTAQRILLDAPCPVLAVKADGRSGRGRANGAHEARPAAE